MSRSLERVISLPQAVALYVAAVLGAGVLLLPGLAATTAGPASMLAWAFDALLGAPLALTFAALGARYPDAGGVATFASRAFGGGVGAAVGWMYIVGAAIGQIIVPLIGASYIAAPLGLDRNGAYLIAAGILAIPIAANLRGLQVSGRVALGLSALVAGLLLAAALVSLPRQRLAAWTPFAPHGWGAVGQTTVLLLFAFSGWEVVASLGAEFKHPQRDIPRSVMLSVAIITVLYLAVAAAIIGAREYGSPARDSVSVALLLSGGLGVGAALVAAVIAVIVCVGTINAFIAGAARLAYALARDGAAPGWLATLDTRGTPLAGVLLIGGFAEVGLLVSWLLRLDAGFLLALPNTLVLLTYILGMAAGVWLLPGRARWLALLSLALCLAALPFAGVSLWPALLIALIALAYRWARRRLARSAAAP
ncbi:MAG TPA: amino acid permease [Ktedonobacterales bacterium]